MFEKKKKYAVFTVDVEAFGDTVCVSNSGAQFQEDMLDGLDEYMRILDKHGIKATMFSVCRTALAAKDRIQPHIDNGHSLALHSLDHTVPNKLSNEEFREETILAKKLLSEAFHTEIIGYRAPCFGIDNDKLEILRELGFRYDSSHMDFPAANSNDFTMRKFEQLRKGIFRSDGFFEFGLIRHRIFGRKYPISGGGYVRLFNWGIIKSIIRSYIRKHDYYVFYLHPFELSRKKMPFVPNLALRDRFYLNRGLRSFPRKVESIIRNLKRAGYEFVTFDQLADIMKNA